MFEATKVEYFKLRLTQCTRETIIISIDNIPAIARVAVY
jgi:hypothetical protein